MSGIGDSLAEGWWMFYDTFWALVVGFVLSGAVQAFVSRAAMQRSLGDHRPRTVAKASFFGTVSSSCSYAAAALGKTLFARGADFTASQAFVFASTNLVVELGIVLWLLLGWQFAVAEFFGGAVMIALLTVLLPRVVTPVMAADARSALDSGAHGAEPGHDAHAEHEAHAHHGADPHAGHGAPPDESGPWRERIRTRAGWSDAAGYTISDLTMLRRELVIGFVVAGFAAVEVPTSWWRAVFLTGHGFWSSLENAVVGPFIAVISFVCSVGNVPLAAALWQGGSSFAGVVSFVFADLITLPLLLIYRKYYGTRLTLRLLGVFWLTMSAAGLVTEGVFSALGLVPSHSAGGIAGPHVGWNYTTVLDVLALLGFLAVYRLYRTRPQSDRYAKDPVCGMQVEVQHAPAVRHQDGEPVYFCSDHCASRWDTRAGGRTLLAMAAQDVDPVCGMTGDYRAISAEHAGKRYGFCGEGCRSAFVADPDRYLSARR